MEAFNGKDVDPLAWTAFRIVFMDAEGEHLGDQSGAQAGGTEENMGIAIAYMVGRFLQRDAAV